MAVVIDRPKARLLLAAAEGFLEAARRIGREAALGAIVAGGEQAIGAAFGAQGKAFLRCFEGLRGRFTATQSLRIGGHEITVRFPVMEAVQPEDWDPLFVAATGETRGQMAVALREVVRAALAGGGATR